MCQHLDTFVRMFLGYKEHSRENKQSFTYYHTQSLQEIFLAVDTSKQGEARCLDSEVFVNFIDLQPSNTYTELAIRLIPHLR